MPRHRKHNLTKWLPTLFSCKKSGSQNTQIQRTNGRKLLLEALECRRVFDAGWASTMDNTLASAMDGDSFGNQYVTGAVVPSGSTIKTFENLNVVDANNNIFVAKQNSNGQFVWTAFAGNTTVNSVSSRVIAADNNGSVFIAGRFNGNAKFGSQVLTSVGDYDGFVAKLNASTGQFLWARQIGGTGKDIARGLDIDPSGNVIVTGGLSMSASASNDAPTMFIVKLDTNGTTLWNNTISGDTNMTGSLSSPVFDSVGNIYVGGRFQGVLNLPTGTLTSQATLSGISSFGPTDGLVAKLDSNGNFLWGRSLAGDSTQFVDSLAMGPSGQLYISGTISGRANLDGIQLVGTGGRDGFVASMNANTGTVDWANRMGGTGDDFLTKISVNANGDIYAVGTFDTQADFGSQTLSSDGKVNAFVSKISPQGQFLGSNRFLTGSTSPDLTANNTPSLKGLHIDSTGGVIVLGSAWWGGSTAWTGVQAPQKPITARLSSLTYVFDFVFKLPPTEPTKFYVVDDSNRDRTYQYGSSGELTIDNFSINAGNNSPRGAASNATGTKVWVGDKNKNVYLYSSDGILQGSWSAGSLPSSASVEGVATNGTDVWIVENSSDRVYRYSGAANRVSGSQTAVSNFKLNTANANPKGIVTDGTHIWVLNDSTVDRIFKYTVAGSFLGSWTIDTSNKSPTGLTIDPTNGSQSIWVVDNVTDKIYEYANARGRTSGNQVASAKYALAVGNTNPQGIADPPPPIAVQATAVAVDSKTTAAPAVKQESAVTLDGTVALPNASISIDITQVRALGTDEFMTSINKHDDFAFVSASSWPVKKESSVSKYKSNNKQAVTQTDADFSKLIHQLALDFAGQSS